jgi:hypothetical protein
VVAHIFEYDDAYRYRIQDIATEVIPAALETNPKQEILRLFHIYSIRDTSPAVIIKFYRVVKLLCWALVIPKVKKAFIKAITGRTVGMRYDDADWYWVSMRDDYHFGGVDYETRSSQLKKRPQGVELSLKK